MADEIKNTVEEETGGAEHRHVITLKTPYQFEGREYSEIDLSGLEQLTVKDAVDAQRRLINAGEAAASLVCETTTAFSREIAAKASGLPIEFFKLMPRRVSRLVFAEVIGVMGSEQKTVGHVMRLEKPYAYKGETYESVDLNGLAELNSMNESAAENKMALAGFPIGDTSNNTLYACLLAGMATGLSEDFFLGLPLCEVIKLRKAVNDGDFFE